MEKGIVAGALFLNTLLSPAPTPAPKTSQPTQQEMSTYRVKEGDSLLSIADSKYGDQKYWTNIWDDNEFIKDPNHIEKDWDLKIEKKKTEKPKDLSDKLEKLYSQEDQLALVEAKEESISLSKIQTATPASTTQATPAQSAPTNSPQSLTEAQINFLGSCESGMTAQRNSGNGFYGAFQFTIGTWNAMGTGYERADMAPIDVQKDAVQRLLSRSSIYSQFPGCSSKMRNAGLL